MMFGDNKVVLKQRAKDGMWFYDELSFTNKNILVLLDLVEQAIYKAESKLEKYNEVVVDESPKKKKKPGIGARM